MAHKVQVNDGQVQIALPDGEVYDGPVEVILTDAQFNRIRPALFPAVLTDLGSLPDPDIDAEFVTHDELESASAGQELGYAERLTTDTTTNLADDDATLAANLITGLSVTVTGTGRPVEVELFLPVVTHSAVGGVVYATIMANGSRISSSQFTTYAANKTGHMLCKRRMVLTDGVEYVFTVAKTLDTAGTGTYFMADDFIGYLSVVQR